MYGSRKLTVGSFAILLLAASAAFAQGTSGQQAGPGNSSGQQVAPAEPRASLNDLLMEAEAKNPAIQSASHKVLSLRARVPQARTLPDPVASVGWMGSIKPFVTQQGDPSSFRSIGATQEIPYPGKLKLRGQIADREAEAAWWDYEATRRSVLAEVKVAYYDYGFATKAIEITYKNKDLLEKLIKIARVRYQVGKGIQQDVLRAQVELSKLLQQITILEQQKRTAQARLNTLLLRSPEDPIGSPEAPQKPDLGYSLDQIYQIALEKDPGLQRGQRMIEQNQYAVNLAQKQYRPDFAVGFQYLNRPAMPEMYGATVSLNIPVFYKTRQREGVREATEGLVSAERSKEDRRTTLFFEIKELYLAAKSADDLAKLYSEAIVPQSSLALESALASYQVGSLDFLSLITDFTTVLEYQVGYYEQLTSYEKALARLEVNTGLDLTR
jgi:cobalt-zinc-cadmium efflux system outer membrane protein